MHLNSNNYIKLVLLSLYKRYYDWNFIIAIIFRDYIFFDYFDLLRDVDSTVIIATLPRF